MTLGVVIIIWLVGFIMGLNAMNTLNNPLYQPKNIEKRDK